MACLQNFLKYTNKVFKKRENAARRRLRRMRVLRELGCKCAGPTHRYSLTELFSLYRKLHVTPECTKLFVEHWLPRNNEAYLNWKKDANFFYSDVDA